MHQLQTILGFIGSILAASLFYPQVYQSYKTKHTRDLSWTMIIIGIINCCIWISYGLLKQDPFLWFTNIIIVTGLLTLFILKRKYK